MSSILIPTGKENHLFVALTDKDKDNRHLFVNISSIKPSLSHDPACELASGCHRFVTKPSFVRYELCERLHHDHVLELVDTSVANSFA